MIRSSQASATSWPGLALFIFKVIYFCFIVLLTDPALHPGPES